MPLTAPSSPAPSALPSPLGRGRGAGDEGDHGEVAARRERLRLVADRVRPTVLVGERTLPVLAPLAPLMVGGCLRRGGAVAVAGVGALSLAWAVTAGPAGAGAWVAAVGVDGANPAAAAEMGVPLERLLVVDVEPRRAPAALATLVGAVDVVVVGARCRLRPADVRRLGARARERGSVFVPLGSWPAPDTTLTIEASRWVGLERGHGWARARRVRVRAGGRGAAARSRRAELWLPGPDGTVAEAEPDELAGASADEVGPVPVAVGGGDGW